MSDTPPDSSPEEPRVEPDVSPAPDLVPPAPNEAPVFEQASTEAVEAPEPAPPLEPTAPQPTVTSEAAQAPHFGPGRCPRCGGIDFGKGTLITYGTRFRPAYYKPARFSFRRLHNMLRPFRAVVEVEAQACRECGLVLFQVDTEKLAKLEKRSR